MTDLSWLRRQAQLSRTAACELCGVSMRTWERWESGRVRTPKAVVQLLTLLGGDLSLLGWSGWRIANGELYGPEMPAYRRGLRPGEVRAGWWLTWMASSRRYHTAKVMTKDAANANALRSNYTRLKRRDGAAVLQARSDAGQRIETEDAD